MNKLVLSIILIVFLVASCSSSPDTKSSEELFLNGCSPERVERYAKEVIPTMTLLYKQFDASAWYRLDTSTSISKEEKESIVHNAHCIYMEIQPLVPPSCLVDTHQDLLSVLKEQHLILDEMLLTDVDMASRVSGAEEWENEINGRLGELDVVKNQIFVELLAIIDEIFQAEAALFSTQTPKTQE